MQDRATRLGLLEAAMDAPDDIVASIMYLSLDGKLSRRTVSPIQYLTGGLLRVYCLGQQGPRTLRIKGILDVRIRAAVDVLTPEQIERFQHGKKEARAAG